MRIIFMGTPQFAVPCLERLVKDGHEIPAVFCQPDKPQGRKMQLAAPPVKTAALAQGLRVEQPDKLRGSSEVLALLQALAPELIVVVAYGKILPEALLGLPRHGCINVHASLLPQYRGAAPIQWAVLNGEARSGVTTMQMDPGIDTGDMLLRRECPIPEDMTAGELHDRLSALGAQALAETLAQLEQGRLCPQPQDHAAASHAPMLSRALSPINWERPAREIHNQIRGLHPWPAAVTEFDGKPLKIHRACVSQHCQGPLDIRCGDGNYIHMITVQAEGKKAMPAEEFLRGLRR